MSKKSQINFTRIAETSYHHQLFEQIKNANDILKKYSNILKQEERNVIFYNNISASHFYRDSQHLIGTIMLAGYVRILDIMWARIKK